MEYLAEHILQELQPAKDDPVFSLMDKYLADKDPRKVNLTLGAYRGEDGLPWVLPAIEHAEHALQDEIEHHLEFHEYLQIAGDERFNDAALSLLMGPESKAVKEKRMCTVQTISGSGAIYVATKFLSNVYSGKKPIYVSRPTWPMYFDFFESAGIGFLEYPYYDEIARTLDMKGMLDTLKMAPEESLILLQACAHNPTGLDPTKEQWDEIALVCKMRNHLVFFDAAYLGLASGDLNEDAFPVRQFVDYHNITCFVAQSFSKNFGLYSERVGCLSFASNTEKLASIARSHFKKIILGCWATPPAHGAKVVSKILRSPQLRDEWLRNIRVLDERMKSARVSLFEALKKRGVVWDHLLIQKGMFSYSGLSSTQIDYLRGQCHIYMLQNGRISICGTNPANVDYVADSIVAALQL